MKTVSNPQWAGQFKTTYVAHPPRFTGQKEYEQYRDRLRGFSPDSFERIADIAQASHQEGADHIALSVAYSKADPDVSFMIQEITRLIHNRGSDNSQTAVKAQAVEHLADFRRAIATVLQEKGYSGQGKTLTEAERSRLLKPSQPQTRARL